MDKIRCPNCLFPVSEYLFEIGDRLFGMCDDVFQIRKCISCNIHFIYPVPTSKDLAGNYPDAYWISADKKNKQLRRFVIECYRHLALFNHLYLINRVAREHNHEGTPVNILDVGCGDGSFLKACGISFCTGIDFSSQAVEAARRRGLNVVHGSFLEHPFKEKSFSIITMFHFLEHVLPVNRYLKTAKRILKKNGDLIIQVPNVNSWQAQIMKKRWAGYDVPRHLLAFSPDTLCSQLDRCGFRVVKQSHFSLRDNAATFANSIFPELYPPSRMHRERFNSDSILAWLKDLLFLMTTLSALPFTFLESYTGHGATITVQAKPV